MTRRFACAVAAALLLAACGKYGPPVRTTPDVPPGGAKKTAPVSAAPATSNSEQCNDPNAAPVEAKP